MKTSVAMVTASLVVVLVGTPGATAPLRTQASTYEATRDGDIVRLRDARHRIAVSVVTSVGNMAYEMTVKGQQILRFPFATVDEFKARPTGLHGIPLMAPWANRLDEPAFHANGTRYAFDMTLGNVRGAVPIHGFLSRTDQWQVIDVRADAHAAWVTSRLECSRQPAWMKQWPFAHTIEMTYRLADGALEVRTTIINHSADPMPVSIGYHPYFQLTDSPRDGWAITVPARTRWLLSAQKVPTGDTEPTDSFFTDFMGTLGDYNLDDVFTDLVRDGEGLATARVKGRRQQIDVVLGPNYRALVVYAPNPANKGRGSQAAAVSAGPVPTAAGAGQAPASGKPAGAAAPNPLATPDFVCLEPMVAITNALNLAHKGVYRELQSIAPGATWRESFWVKPSGF